MLKFINNIKALILGLFTVFKQSFRTRVTGEYPEKQPNIPERFRGLHEWNSEKCCACKICENSCPAAAININKNEKNLSFKVDLKKCIFCGNCLYNCPKNAITMTNKFDLATDNKDDLIIEINSLNSDDESNIINK